MPRILPNPVAPDPAPGLTSAHNRSIAERRSLDAPAPLALWHLASLDAPTVAVVWSLSFAWAARVRLPLWVTVLQALVAWAVYVADRLLDARGAIGCGALHRLRQRHHFHWRHRRVLAPLGAVAACAAAGICVALMPAGARHRNSILAAAALAYFTSVHSGVSGSRFPAAVSTFLAQFPSKELIVGVLFTAGCALPALSRVSAESAALFWALTAAAVFFAFLAWLNCHMIERWESLDNHLPNPILFSPAWMLALAGLLTAAILYSIAQRPAALIAAGAASALLLALLHRLRERLTPLALRAAADLVLLTPAFLAPLALLRP